MNLKNCFAKTTTVVTVLISLFNFSTAAATSKKIVYQKVKNEALGLQFVKPKNWKNEKTNAQESYVDYVLDTPEIDTESGTPFMGNIGISKINPDKGKKINLQEEVDKILKIFENADGFEKNSEKSQKMLGKMGKEIVVSFNNATEPKIKEKLAITLVVYKNKLYACVLDMAEEAFEEYEPIYKKVRASIQPLKK